MSVVIEGFGTATPPCSIEQPDAAEIARTFVHGEHENLSLLPILYRMTLVHRRASVILDPPTGGESYKQSFYPEAEHPDDRGPSTRLRMQRYGVEAGPLAVRASQAAFDNAGATGDQITHLVTVSCTGFQSPGVEFRLIRDLGLSPSIARANIGFMGCHGALNALGVAQAFIESNRQARVLLCSTELCSLHYYYGWDSEKVVANALFADGAAALVLSGEDSTESTWGVAATESLVLPDSAEEMTWSIGDHGFEMTLAARVPNLIEQQLRPWMESFLAKHDLTIEQIGSWAIHPGGPRIIAGVTSALGLEKEAAATSLEILAEHGNMSSATMLFVLQRLQKQNAKLPCLALGFGPGLVAEAALFV